jgi:uroporphyrin-III C-methyltransferase
MRHETPLGTVRLVGAGPGPADLLTLRAARLIGNAGALLYDALVWDEVVALAPAACFKVQTGKRAGRASMRQETINRLMLRLARRGIDVVRLKGGDPSIFGRVGEEIEFLEGHGVSVEVTPGVSAACAAAAQFKFPLTHRGEARRVVFTTARLKDGELVGDWRVAADPEATAAIYMGGAGAAKIAERLITAGRSGFTPVVTVENAGAADARVCATTLHGLAQDGAAQAGGPLLIIVGEVTARADAVRSIVDEAGIARRV